MPGSKRFISFVNDFSILIPLGALSTGYFFYRYANSSQSLWFFWLLPSSMWLIYSLDHALDAWRARLQSDLPPRYEQNFRLRRWLLPVYGFVAGLNLVLAFLHLDTFSLRAGVCLALNIALYLVASHMNLRLFRNGHLKEFFIAGVVTVGIGVFPFFPEWWTLLKVDVIVLLLAFFLINLANLRMFARFDAADDHRLGMSSSAGNDDRQNSLSVQRTLILAFGACALWLFRVPYPEKMSAMIVMMVLLNGIMIINQWKERFADGGYRFWGDFIYLLPGPIAWWFYL